MGKQMSISELREELSDSIRGIREGTQSAANANAITNAVGKILSTVKLELEYCKLTGKPANIGLLAAPEETT